MKTIESYPMLFGNVIGLLLGGGVVAMVIWFRTPSALRSSLFPALIVRTETLFAGIDYPVADFIFPD